MPADFGEPDRLAASDGQDIWIALCAFVQYRLPAAWAFAPFRQQRDQWVRRGRKLRLLASADVHAVQAAVGSRVINDREHFRMSAMPSAMQW